MAIVYLISIFADTLILAFHLWPLTDPLICTFNSILSGIMIFDIILKFFQAYRANTNVIDESDNEEEELVEAKATAKVAAENGEEDNEEDSLTNK